MPAASTHYIFSKDLINLLKEKEIEISNKSMFYLGAQGPDLFFYDKGGFTKDSLTSFGSIMHIKKIYEVVSFIFGYSADDEDLKSYFYGYLAHYALDSTMHPFIDYFAMKVLSESDNNVAHREVESCIDFIMLERTDSVYDVYKHLCITKKDSEKLASMYSEMFSEILGIDIEKKKIISAIGDCPRMLKLLKPSKPKIIVARLLSKIIKPLRAASANIIRDNHSFKADIENAQEGSYFNPKSGEAIEGGGLFDIYDMALKKAVDMIELPQNFCHYKKDFNGN